MTKVQQLISDAEAAGLDVRRSPSGGADIIKGPRTGVRVFANGWCLRLDVDLACAACIRTDVARKILGLKQRP